MIGDNQALDFQAARASGWHAIWLAREQPSLLDSGRINSLCDLRLLSARFT
jgi:FMN phosphatase YigB (HAD superfamily)